MVIDKLKDEYMHIPSTLEGEVLLEEIVDENGNIKGWHTIDAGVLKHFALTKNPQELKFMGFEKFADKIEAVKNREDILEKIPKGI